MGAYAMNEAQFGFDNWNTVRNDDDAYTTPPEKNDILGSILIKGLKEGKNPIFYGCSSEQANNNQ